MFGEAHPSPQLASCVDDLVQHVSVRITRRQRQGPRGARRPSAAHPTTSNLRRNLHEWQQDGAASESAKAAPQRDVDESSTSKKKKGAISHAYEYTEARAYKSKVGMLYRELQRKLMVLEDVPQETQVSRGGGGVAVKCSLSWHLVLQHLVTTISSHLGGRSLSAHRYSANHSHFAHSAFSM